MSLNRITCCGSGWRPPGLYGSDRDPSSAQPPRHAQKAASGTPVAQVRDFRKASGLAPNRHHHRAAGVDRSLLVALLGQLRVFRRVIGDAHAVIGNPAALGGNPSAVINGAIVLTAHGVSHFARIDEMIKNPLIGRAVDAVVDRKST